MWLVDQNCYWRTILNFVFLEFNHIYKTQQTSLFSFCLLIFFNCFIVIVTLSTFLYFSTACKHTGWVFVFCKLTNLQKYVGMVSTNDITYSEQILQAFSIETIPHFCFWLRREGHQMLIAEKTEKSSHQKFSIKILFLKSLQYWHWQENTCVKHRMVASEPTLWSDCLELCFWFASWCSNARKIPVAFKPKL